MNRQYQELRFEGRAEVLRTLADGENSKVVEAILGAATASTEFGWVESAALALTRSQEYQLQRAGLLSLGILVRRFASDVDLVSLRATAERLGADERLSGTVEDLLDDLEVFTRDPQPLDVPNDEV